MTAPPSTAQVHGGGGDLVIGLAGALLVFAAVPAVLIGLVGVPLPHTWTAASVLSVHSLFDALAIVSWLAWAACAWGILRSVLVRLRTKDLSPGRHLLDSFALRIALGTLSLSALFGAGAATAGAATAGAPHAGGAVVACASGAPGTRAGAAVVARAHVASATHQVIAGRFADHGISRTIHATAGGSIAQLDASSSRGPGGRVPPTRPVGGSSLPVLPLAELGGAAFSALVAALLARRSRQLRRLQAYVREEGEPVPAETEAQVELDLSVARFLTSPLLDWVELAARLPIALATEGTEHNQSDAVLAIRAGSDGVEVFFPQPITDPHGESDRTSWWVQASEHSLLLPATLDPDTLRRAARDAPPWCPILLPVGSDRRGSWLLSLPSGGAASVIGPRAQDLIRVLEAAETRWSWSEQVLVTRDPGEARQAVAAWSTPTEHPRSQPCPPVLFVGDPSELSSDLQRRCTVLASVPVDGALVTVVVDDSVASIHPLGLAIAPNLIGPRWDPALHADVSAESTTPDADRAAPPSTGSRGTVANAVARHPAAAIRVAPPDGEAHPRHQRGQVEVCLLGALPEITGLFAELPAKRARRAIEVVAYLALHHPDPVTSDRLRTRVLGSAETDAASKTLFNTAGAARTALGVDGEGRALLPRATRAGLYTISPLVTVDAARACALLEAGRASTVRDEAHALLLEGLTLIRGEPLGGVLTGYEWWVAEGHLRRLAGLCVDGACSLARGALASHDIDLARWAVEQARRVEQYSETLSRMAMRVAAAAGDVARLHFEWKDCRRQLDEIDPGSLPSDTTEHLYARLRLQIGAGPATDAAPRALGA